MPIWRTEAIRRVAELVDDGQQPEDAIRGVLVDYDTDIFWEAETSLLGMFLKKQKDVWAEPPADMEQLRFDLGGHEISISDAPVRYVDADGQERFKPARHSTAVERLDSIEARIQHHQSWVRRSEADHSRERQQNAVLVALGIDLRQTWDQIRHTETVCWRCLEGWRAGDPFEQGHRDRPQSRGGVEVAWEHQSCNRSAKANPVAEPMSANS